MKLPLEDAMSFQPYARVALKSNPALHGTVLGSRTGSKNPKRPNGAWVRWDGGVPEQFPFLRHEELEAA